MWPAYRAYRDDEVSRAVSLWAHCRKTNDIAARNATLPSFTIQLATYCRGDVSRGQGKQCLTVTRWTWEGGGEYVYEQYPLSRSSRGSCKM